ncbi:MAG: HEAT repeat domain-containing protein [Methanomicrobiales archaeon]|nr:HEAT repeat domain-containing protein [Methanomicrobiales archaeon]
MPGAASLPGAGAEFQESGILKPFLIGVFTMVVLLLHAYAITSPVEAFSRQILPLFPLLYCIPIVLAAIWYPRRGLLFICVLVGISIGMILFGYANGIPFDPLILVYLAIYVWVVAAISLFTMGQWKRLSRFLSARRMEGAVPRVPGVKEGDPAREQAEPGSGEDIDSLLSTLTIQDPRVRKAAIASLGRSGDPRAVAPLVALMSDENRVVREASAQALGSLGELAVAPLLEALGDPDWHIRMGSAIALRIIGDPRAVEPLMGALGDENRFVRREAVKSLGRMGDPRATDLLIAALADPDSGVRIRAAAALGKIADPKALPPLTRAASDRNPELHDAAVEAISKIKNHTTLPE